MEGLRDIHEPLAPGWWPPAPGWWVLALVAAIGVVWGLRHLLRHRRRSAPYREARARFASLDARRSAGAIDARTFANDANAVLKALLVETEHRADAIRASGDAWLALLRQRCREPGFTETPGRLLGDARFRRTVDDDGTELAALLRRTLGRLGPRT